MLGNFNKQFKWSVFLGGRNVKNVKTVKNKKKKIYPKNITTVKNVRIKDMVNFYKQI